MIFELAPQNNLSSPSAIIYHSYELFYEINFNERGHSKMQYLLSGSYEIRSHCMVL